MTNPEADEWSDPAGIVDRALAVLAAETRDWVRADGETDPAPKLGLGQKGEGAP